MEHTAEIESIFERDLTEEEKNLAIKYAFCAMYGKFPEQTDAERQRLVDEFILIYRMFMIAGEFKDTKMMAMLGSYAASLVRKMLLLNVKAE
jgi:hypothetical protein